jgi:hypothetical protein
LASRTKQLHQFLFVAASLQLIEVLSKLSSLILARASGEAAFLSYKLGLRFMAAGTNISPNLPTTASS